MKSTDEFRRLVAVVKANKALGQAVRTLECEDVQDSLAAPSEVDIRLFFHSLSRLSSLVLLTDCPPVRRVAFSSFYTRICPLSLTSLSVVASPSWTRPWEPALFRTFTSLTSLCLCVDVDAIPSPSPATSVPQSTLPFLEALVLDGANLDCPVTRTMLEAGPNLLAVTLRTSDEEPNFLPLLPLLPGSLCGLRLETPGSFDLAAIHACDAALSGFPDLNHLHLGQGTFDRTTVADSLAKLPRLAKLSFGRAANILPGELQDLLDGPTRLPSLRVLVLDLLTPGKRGYRVDFLSPSRRLHPYHDDHPFHLAPDWVVPEYTNPDEGFRTRDAFRLAALGKRVGVEVTGTAIDGTTIYFEACEEMDRCLTLWAWQSGEEGQLVDTLGTHRASQLLMQLDGDRWRPYEDEEFEPDYPSRFTQS